MRLETVANGTDTQAMRFDPVEQLTMERQKVQQESVEPSDAKSKVSSEELLKKIKDLSQDGLYSIHFEMNDATDQLVIRVIDRNSGDVIRQIPSEELLEISRHLKDFRGNMVDTEG